MSQPSQRKLQLESPVQNKLPESSSNLFRFELLCFSDFRTHRDVPRHGAHPHEGPLHEGPVLLVHLGGVRPDEARDDGGVEELLGEGRQRLRQLRGHRQDEPPRDGPTDGPLQAAAAQVGHSGGCQGHVETLLAPRQPRGKVLFGSTTNHLMHKFHHVASSVALMKPLNRK